MDPLTKSLAHFSRRGILKSGALALLPFGIPSAKYAMADQRPMTANGGTDPYLIPSLDKNGSHNQPAGPNLEPSHIYHFKGQVARSSTFTGMGTDNQGNRIAFGSPTTDYGVMQGDGSRNTARDFHTHMTNVVQGAGGPCKSNTRLSSSDFAIWTLLGCAGPGAWPHHQSRWAHFHARNAERASVRPAALAGSGVHCHSRKHDFQDGLENHWRTREI